jgi:cell wall-associated NlpC family hydrolase
LYIPFKERGCDYHGCDCWGLVRLILLEQQNIELPTYSEVEEGANLQKLKAIGGAALSEQWEEITKGDERAFDVVLMKGQIEHEGSKYSRPIHIGCVVKPGMLIHIELGSEVSVVDYRNHPRVKHRVVGFYRYRYNNDIV